MAKPVLHCFKADIVHAWPITLDQYGPDNFTVTYGKQIKDELDYADAARELGYCIMHAG